MQRKHLLPAVPCAIIATLVCLGQTNSVMAGVNTWTGPGLLGTPVNTLLIDPSAPATIYAGVSFSGVLKSTDGGATWNPSNTGISNQNIQALEIHPSSSNILYAASYNNGFFVSIDSGATWTASNTGLVSTSLFALAIDPVTPANLYVGLASSGGAQSSTDGGANWNPVGTGIGGLSTKSMMVDPAAPSTVYAGTDDGVYKSTDGGATWNPSNTGMASVVINGFVMDPSSPSVLYAATVPDGVYKSIDSGASWSQSGLAGMYVYCLAIHPVNPSTLYAGTASGVYVSLDGGGNWYPFKTGMPSGARVFGLAIDPSTPSIVHAGTSESVGMNGSVYSIQSTTPGAFGKTDPAAGAHVTTTPTLQWSASAGAVFYEYCIDTSDNDACDASWIGTDSTNVSLSGLTKNTFYYWQVRAVNPADSIEADSGAWYSFQTLLFDDVPYDHYFRIHIEAFYDAGITNGCGIDPFIYCPDRSVTRAEMAVFLERAMHYPALPYTPPAAGGYFDDMPVAGKEWMEDWVDEFYRDGITTGCGFDPLVFCPERAMTRGEAAIFILRALYGSGYVPPAAGHFFDDVPVAGKEWMEAWIDQFYREGITTGCGYAPLIYCPEDEVTRAEVAVFIVRAFDLPLL